MSFREVSVTWIAVVAGCFTFSAAGAPTLTSTDTAGPSGPTINVRDLGAVGDGQLHTIQTWIDAGKFRNLGAIKKRYPFVDDLTWSVDEVAFTDARTKLPASGGTIYFPAGNYVSGNGPWTIRRDHVRILGDGPDKTTLTVAAAVDDGLVLSPYRHGGWLKGARQEIPFLASDGKPGDDTLTLRVAKDAEALKPGDLVFIRSGANRFDQDYGEFNEVAFLDPNGKVRFKHPFSRDYTLDQIKSAGETTAEFALPRVDREVTVPVNMKDPNYFPGVNEAINVGDFTFRVVSRKPLSLTLANPGRGNPPPGTVVPVGARVASARSIVKLTQSSRGFRAEGVTIIGHRRALSISNSYDLEFKNCAFVRDITAGGFKGGLTIDGDGGRFARFERCTLTALPAAGMQLARSYGSVSFVECRFVNADVSFTEFCFDGEVTRCEFQVTGNKNLTSAVIAGQSCTNLRFIDNHFRVAGMPFVFDGMKDIQSYRRGNEGNLILRGNTIEAAGSAVKPYRWTATMHPVVEGTTFSKTDSVAPTKL